MITYAVPDTTPVSPASFEYLTGFEGTHIFGLDTDVLATTQHSLRYEGDFACLRADGIRTFRCCIPWHAIERVEGTYDWSWLDEYMASIRRHGLNPIVDPLHHTSTPAWLTDGFANPECWPKYESFVLAFADRYPWVTHYTIINEPFVTAWLAGFCGLWYPHHHGYEGFVPIILGMAKTICSLSEKLTERVPGVHFLHVDTCEEHHALDAASESEVFLSNERRFVVLDLILGRVHEEHPMYHMLSEHGYTGKDVEWFKAHPARIDTLGLDYYPHSEIGWRNVHEHSQEFVPSGFKQVARAYLDRYEIPLMLSETNIRGRIEDRLSWLKYMVGECEALARELAGTATPLTGFCWYPYIDSTDWCHLVSAAHTCTDGRCANAKHIDPQGVYWLDTKYDRHASELSETYAQLSLGTIRSDDMPAYEFEDAVLDGRSIRKFLPLMNGWKWILPLREAA